MLRVRFGHDLAMVWPFSWFDVDMIPKCFGYDSSKLMVRFCNDSIMFGTRFGHDLYLISCVCLARVGHVLSMVLSGLQHVVGTFLEYVCL